MRKQQTEQESRQELRVSEQAVALVDARTLRAALALHFGGRFGRVDPDTAHRNRQALAHGGRVISVYRSEEGRPFVISSDHYRDSGTVRTWVRLESETPVPRMSLHLPYD